MVTINWLSRYELGIPEIDAQHLRLFEVVNELIEQIREGARAGQVMEVVDHLVSIALEHFRTEEAWMERQGFPGLEAHRMEHQHIQRRIFELKPRLDGGERLTMEVTILLADWLEYHISDCDQAFADYSRGVNIP
jgi:hemerythrin-like metal-binding protein